MDDNAKNTSSYQQDQEILDARGINMTVEEVAGLSTCKYSEKVQSLKLNQGDLAFLKGLRRRIKNRLASQNSRRRSVEHLRRLARELRAVRACRDDTLAERSALLAQRDSVRDKCIRLRRYIVQILQDRSDISEIPFIDVGRTQIESQKQSAKIITVTETKTPLLPECFETTNKIFEKSDKKIFDQSNKQIFEHSDKQIFEHSDKEIFEHSDKSIFECRIDKLVQKSVNHIFKNDSEKKKVFAKTVFISNEKLSSDIKSMVLCQSEMKIVESDNGVLNLSLKEGRRKSHGRKQLAPRRIAYMYSDCNDRVLDLKIKKEPQ